MSTKGPSNRYGNTNGANHRGKATQDIKYQWANGFNKNTLSKHFNEHGTEFNTTSKEEYVSKAIKFANTVDRINNRSVVDNNDTTYKYSLKTNELVIVNKNGKIRSYYHVNEKHNNKFHYTNKKGDIVWIKIK